MGARSSRRDYERCPHREEMRNWFAAAAIAGLFISNAPVAATAEPFKHDLRGIFLGSPWSESKAKVAADKLNWTCSDYHYPGVINCYSGDEPVSRLEIEVTSGVTNSKIWRITFDFQTSDDLRLVSEKIQKAFGLPLDATKVSKNDPFLQYRDAPVTLLATRTGVFYSIEISDDTLRRADGEARNKPNASPDF